MAASLLAGAAIFIQVGWLLAVFTAADPVEVAHRDWIQFHRTGERVLAGAFEELYPGTFEDDGRPEFDDGFYFMYPPFVAWLTVPLGLLTPLGAYVACVMVVMLATLAATLALTRGLRMRGTGQLFGMLGTAASAPWNGAVILGHLSGTLVASPALAFLAWRAGRPLHVGAALGLLLAKPNWGVPMLLLLAAGRRWRMLAGAVLMGVLLVLLSLPFGLDVWAEWGRTMVGYRSLVADGTPPWRQATLFASIESVLGSPGSDKSVVILWLLLGGTLFLATSAVWYLRAEEDGLVPRLIGVALLAVVATNPYAHFYDALLPLPAALLLWAGAETWTMAGLLKAARITLGLTWAWMHYQYLVKMSAAPSLVGIGFSVWLVLELVDLGRGARRARANA